MNSFVALPDEGPPDLIPDINDESVQLMLRLLRDRDWFIARNASLVLARHIGEKSPAVLEYFLSPQEREDSIRAFNVWWQAEEKRIEKAKRG